MSHQRVHQIIGTDGIVEVEPSAVIDVSPASPSATAAGAAVTPTGSAAVAVTASEDACSFCGTRRAELDKLLAGPGPVFICAGCVAAAASTVGGDPAGDLRAVPVEHGAICSFCGNPSGIGGVMAEAAVGPPRICTACTVTCQRILADDRPARPVMRRSGRVRCSFCNTSQSDTAHLVAGPNVYICDGCVGCARQVEASAASAKGPRQVVLRPAVSEDHPCGFCGAGGASGATMVKGGRGRICGTCLDVCDRVIREGC